MLPRLLKPLLITTFLIGTGIWLIYFGWTRVQADQRLDQSSAVTSGRVVDAASRALSKGGQSSSLTVEYTPAGHAPITRKFDVDGRAYRSGVESGMVQVTYLPEEPQVARVVRFDPLPYWMLVGFGAIVLLAGLLCLGLFWRKGV
ncbi:MAG: DUF3592 domain-containing protein [Verrucomicrobiales bacterium]|nr:DUF3592 domain-containing protein [Verrucomicrobiales bacterium]